MLVWQYVIKPVKQVLALTENMSFGYCCKCDFATAIVAQSVASTKDKAVTGCEQSHGGLAHALLDRGKNDSLGRQTEPS